MLSVVIKMQSSNFEFVGSNDDKKDGEAINNYVEKKREATQQFLLMGC